MVRKLFLVIVIVATVPIFGCSGSGGNDVTTPEVLIRDLSMLEGTWDYSMYAFVVTQFGDTVLVSQDNLDYAFTITPESIYDPYYEAYLPWFYDGDDLILDYNTTLDVDEFYGYTDISVDTQVEYHIALNATKTEMVISGTSVSNVTFINPDSLPEEVTSTTTYNGTATRQ